LKNRKMKKLFFFILIFLIFSCTYEFPEDLDFYSPGNELRPFIDFNDNGFTQYPQPVVVQDESLSDGYYPDGTPLPKIRQLEPGELLLLSLPLDQVENNGLGSFVPISEKYYLNEDKILIIQSRINAYNAVISQIVNDYKDRIVLLDLNTSINELALTGKIDAWDVPSSSEVFSYDGVPIKADLSLNSIFSLDGLHFNQKGNAFVTNKIIEIINYSFNANIPTVDINNFVGNTIVNNF